VVRLSVRADPLRTGPVSGLPHAESAEREAHIERIVRVIRSEVGRERSRATLRLDPPELGTIRMHMDLQKDRLLLRIDTQSEMAHRLLTEDVEALRVALAQSGIHLEKVEVRPPPQPFELPTEAGAHSPSQEGSGWQEADQGETGRPERQVAGGGQHLPAGAGERASGDESQPAAELRLNVWA
jgi:flagellar hook-length control protein FliK